LLPLPLPRSLLSLLGGYARLRPIVERVCPVVEGGPREGGKFDDFCPPPNPSCPTPQRTPHGWSLARGK
jgi:hypothetical protein